MTRFDKLYEGLWANINKARKKGTTSSKWKNDSKYRSKMKKAVKKLGKESNQVELDEKKADRCKRRADSAYGKKTSAYKSGAIVRCRQGKIWKKK